MFAEFLPCSKSEQGHGSRWFFNYCPADDRTGLILYKSNNVDDFAQNPRFCRLCFSFHDSFPKQVDLLFMSNKLRELYQNYFLQPRFTKRLPIPTMGKNGNLG